MNAKKRILALLEIGRFQSIAEDKIISICNIQPHSAKRLLAELEDAGIVVRVIITSNGPHYRLWFETLEINASEETCEKYPASHS